MSYNHDYVLYDWIPRHIARLCSLMIIVLILITAAIVYSGQVTEEHLVQQARYVRIHDAILNIQSLTERMRSQQENYFFNKSQESVEKYSQLSAQALRGISEVQRLDGAERYAKLLRKTDDLLQKHYQLFNMAVLSQERLGFDLDQGLLGKMRTTAHELEDLMAKCVKDPKLYVSLLQIRRNEKDFFLKKEYREEKPLSVFVDEYHHRLQHLKKGTKLKAQLTQLLNQYINYFNEVRREQERINANINDLDKVYLEYQIVVYNLIDYSQSYSEELQKGIKSDLQTWKVCIGLAVFIALWIIGLYGIYILRMIRRTKKQQ